MTDKDTRFKPGRSGNPSGRPKSVGIVQELARQHTKAAIDTLVTIAANGESEAARVSAANAILERGHGKAPPASRPVTFDMPAIETAEDVAKAGRVLMRAVATGHVTPADAGEVMRLFEGLARTIEVSELERRLRVLEDGPKPGVGHTTSRDRGETDATH